MQIPQVLAYASALGIAAAIPGPGMVALVARSLRGGFLQGFFVLFGLIVGDLIYLSVAIFGLEVIASNFNSVFTLVRWGASLYLLYLAWQFWFATHSAIEVGQPVQAKDLASAGLSGLTITLGNPKTIAFYLAILPLVIDLNTISLHVWGFVLVPLTILVLLVVGAAFILGSVGVRHLLASARAQMFIFRSAALIMVATAGIMLTKTF
ncbi:MAG: LysE family translocator [Pseudomonadota bacterium]